MGLRKQSITILFYKLGPVLLVIIKKLIIKMKFFFILSSKILLITFYFISNIPKILNEGSNTNR